MINASGDQGLHTTNVPPHGISAQSGNNVTGGSVRLHTVPLNTIDVMQSVMVAVSPGSAGNVTLMVYDTVPTFKYYLLLGWVSTNIAWNDYRVFYPAHILPEGWIVNLGGQAGITVHAYLNFVRYAEEV